MSRSFQVKFRITSNMCDARNQVKARYANSLHGIEVISVVER